MSTLLGQGNLKELKYRRICPFCKTKLSKQYKQYNPDNPEEYHWVKDCPKCDFFQWKEDGTWWNATQHVDSKDFWFNEFTEERYFELHGVKKKRVNPYKKKDEEKGFFEEWDETIKKLDPLGTRARK